MKASSTATKVPEEIEIRVTESWIRLIRYCQVQFPFGDLTIRIANSQPTELLDKKPKVRFDREPTIPTVEA